MGGAPSPYGAPPAYGQPPQDAWNPNAMAPAGYGGPMMQAPNQGMQPMGTPGQHGPKGEVKSGINVLLIGLATCGEISAYVQREEPVWWKVYLLAMVTCGIYGLYWLYARLGPLVQEVQQRAGIQNPQNQGIMFLIPYYNVILIQEELNKAWQAPG